MHFKLITGFKQSPSWFPKLCGYIGATGVHTRLYSLLKTCQLCVKNQLLFLPFSFILAFTLIINLDIP